MAEVRRPTSHNNHVQQTPRIGGCAGAFFNLFDWNNTKRIASTKRLPPERPEKPLGGSKSFREDRSRGCSPSVKTASFEKADNPGVSSGDNVSSRPPVGLVARLMGLESLPEATPSSIHRRSQSFSGSESVYYFSEKDSRPERLPLRDMLKQDHGESCETSRNDKSSVVPTVEYKNRRRVRKGDANVTPIKSNNLVPYVDSPCRSVFALEYKGEKSPFLARLHPSPVLQPSKRHNQMVTTMTTTTTPAALKKCEARFPETAVKVLEEISDNEECFPSEREGMRTIAECAAASSPAGTDLLHSLSMSKTWNRSDGAESVGSRSNRSLMSRSSLSVRDSQRRDRLCRDIFEGSLSDRAQSVSSSSRTGSEGRRILRTQEAAVGDFKTDVRKASSGARKDNSEANSKSSLQHLHRTATPLREKFETLHFQATRNSNGLEDHYDALTSDEESPFASTAVMRKFNTSGEDHRSSLRKSPRKSATSSPTGDFRVAANSRERLIQHEVPSSQLRTCSTPGSLHDGLRPIHLSRNREQENSLPVSTNRVLLTELAKLRSAANSPNHSRRQKDNLKLAVYVKNEAPSKKEKQRRAMATESPALQCHSPLSTGAALKRTRRKAKHGSPKLRESAARKSPSRPNLHEERSLDQDTLEAKKSPGHLTEENNSERSLSNVLLDIALPDSRSIVDMVDQNSNCTDENLCETGEVLLREEVEQITQNPVRDSVSSPKIAQCHSEVLILGMEDLHWDDSTMEHQRGENSSSTRYCGIRASGESVQSFSGALDEDVCNVDFECSPTPQKCAGECSEADFHDEGLAPVLVKRLLGKPSRLDVDMGVTSPISVLKSPFGDEVCTTSESSITESEHRAASDQEQNNTTTTSTETAVAECEINQEEASTSTPVDKIRQAILDISSFKNRDQTIESNQKASPQTEKTFVREVLSAAQLLCSPGRSPNWYERDLAVDPALFEKLEGGEGDFPCESGGMWRCDRKLLFDCVNEAFSQTTCHFKDSQPWLRRPPVLRHRSVRQKLVEEVQEKIHDWQELASHAIDTLIDIDMSSKEGKWTDFSEMVSNIGAEIESMVWQVIVEETVLDLAGSLH